MWLIAESGSTKTEWRLFDEKGLQESVSSRGLNPLLMDRQSFTETLKSDLPSQWFESVAKLWFYCAGSDTESVRKETIEWLKSVFKKAEIEVESDLLAAARAACGVEPGIVAILGTGSNSALYDGKTITEHIRPLGYLLGDEGSGVSLGKSLLRNLLRSNFSEELTQSLYKELGISYDEIMEHVYRSEWPNRFIASCTRCLHAHKDDREIETLIYEEFERFVSLLATYSKADQLKLNFVGSVAFYFEPILKDVVKNKGLSFGNLLRSPADELVNFHIENA